MLVRTTPINHMLKFSADLVPLLRGQAPDGGRLKWATWRFFWEKPPINVGEILLLCGPGGRGEPVMIAKALTAIRKPLGELTRGEMVGHETYPDAATMYKTFAGYYGRPIGPETTVRVTHFLPLEFIIVTQSGNIVTVGGSDPRDDCAFVTDAEGHVRLFPDLFVDGHYIRSIP